MSTGNIPTEDDVLGYIPTISNWGRWGTDDELGTMNNIGPDQIKYATSLVKEGISVSCARTITTERAPDVVAPVLHYMTGSGESSMDTDTNEFVHQQSRWRLHRYGFSRTLDNSHRFSLTYVLEWQNVQ